MPPEADCRVSIEGSEMRHGPQEQDEAPGYKRHIGVDLDTQLIVA
jgi:hypothetical protein